MGVKVLKIHCAKMLVVTLSSFLLFACAASPLKVGDEYEQAVYALYAKKPQEAQERFLALCSSGDERACFLSGKKWNSPGDLAVFQGFSNESEVLIQVLADGSDQFRYFFRPVGPFPLKELKKPVVYRRKGQDHRTERLRALVRPGVTYELLVVDQEGVLRDRRRFSGLKLKMEDQRVALLSCLDDAFEEEQKVMWKRVQDEKPTVIFMIGDNTYGTRENGAPVPMVAPDQLWRRYVETFLTLGVYRWERLVPIFALWDDHDFGMNDGGAHYPHVRESQKIFRSMFPQFFELDGFSRGPGISYRLELEDLNVYFMDNRSFRQPEAQERYGQFGKEQEDWLVDSLKISGRPAWVVSGDQFFGGYHPFESYERDHPKSFNYFLRRVAETGVYVAFLSGDRHLVEVIAPPEESLGYGTYELTSSALHARTYPDSFAKFPNPHQLVGQAGRLNFMILDQFKSDGRRMNWRATALSNQPKPLFSTPLAVPRGSAQ